MYLRLPDGLRLAGLAVGAGSLAQLGWVHQALGGAFSTGPTPRPDRLLVRRGPYAWDATPCIYPFLLTANWVIGGSGLAIIGLLMTFRLAREEQLLARRFGAEYVLYRRSTGRFLPFRRLIRAYRPRREPAPLGARSPGRPRSPSR